MKFFLVVVTVITLALVSSRSIRVSSECNTDGDQLALGKCLRPFLDAWELVRTRDTGAADLVFPVLYFNREEILTLCDAYVEALDTCLSGNVLERCQNNNLVLFVRSQMGYVCGDKAVEMLDQHDCISRTLRSKPQCREHIRGLPLPDLQGDKCRRIPDFFRCLQEDVYERCSTKGLGVLAQAIHSFGCDVTMLEIGMNKSIEQEYKRIEEQECISQY